MNDRTLSHLRPSPAISIQLNTRIIFSNFLNSFSNFSIFSLNFFYIQQKSQVSALLSSPGCASGKQDPSTCHVNLSPVNRTMGSIASSAKVGSTHHYGKSLNPQQDGGDEVETEANSRLLQEPGLWWSCQSSWCSTRKHARH